MSEISFIHLDSAHPLMRGLTFHIGRGVIFNCAQITLEFRSLLVYELSMQGMANCRCHPLGAQR